MVVTDYNEQFLDKRGTDHLIDELKAYIDNLPTGGVDLSDYVTKSELQAKLDALDINIDLSSYATKEELTNAINSIDLSAYALKTEIPSLDGLATTEYVDNAIANVPSGGNVDLSNYYTKAETNALIPSLEGYATEEYVSTAINSIPATDLSNYYTKDETYSKTEVDTLVANSGGSSGSGEEGGGETPTPTPTPTVTMAFTTTTTTVRIGGRRTVKVGYTDSNGTDVTDNYDTVFTITDANFNTSLLTMTDNGNTVTLTFDDENIIGETFTLNAVDSGGVCTPISVSMELVDVM